MASTINQTTALLALARMMGKRTLPNGTNADWKDYVQTAFDYAWRYYRWGWSMRSATVDLVNDPYLPADFDLDGYINPLPNSVGAVSYMSLDDWYMNGQYVNAFSVEWDDSVGRYLVHPGSSLNQATLTLTYQAAPPTLDETTEVPFPSAQTIGIGASIYAKQGENPTRADITQEWDEFHKELNRHVGHSERSRPQRTNMNLQDYYGTYTGDTRG